jgi:hypothetical protein
MAGRPVIDLAGKKFGRLIVLRRALNVAYHAAWECVCDCGRTNTVQGTDLRLGRTVSCGCAGCGRRAIVFRAGSFSKTNSRVYA